MGLGSIVKSVTNTVKKVGKKTGYGLDPLGINRKLLGAGMGALGLGKKGGGGPSDPPRERYKRRKRMRYVSKKRKAFEASNSRGKRRGGKSLGLRGAVGGKVTKRRGGFNVSKPKVSSLVGAGIKKGRKGFASRAASNAVRSRSKKSGFGNAISKAMIRMAR